MVISFRLWPSVVSYEISSFSLSRQEAVIHFNFPLLPIFIFYYCSPPPQLLFFSTRSLSSCIISLLSHSLSSVICICALNDLNLQEVLITAFTFSSALPSCSLPSLRPSHEDMGNCVLCFSPFSSLLLWPLFSSNRCFILSSFGSLSILEGYEKIGHSGEMAQQLK